MNYEELLIESDRENLIVREKDIPGYGGRIYKNRIAIHKGLTTSVEKACALAEELGHHYTTYGNILDQCNTSNRKQELRARAWAYNKQIGLLGLIRAYEHGCRNRFEIAEYLEVTEEVLEECLVFYQSKYGVCTNVDNYVVYFIPNLVIMKKL
ncbi:MAG: ImmA/IrrE family metallo-endopeptidase [Lachnospiraceae bacterium]